MKSNTASLATTKKRKTSAKSATVRLPAPKPVFLLSGGNGSSRPKPEQIRVAAYFNYLNEGCPKDRALQHWLDAEARLLGHSRAPLNDFK